VTAPPHHTFGLRTIEVSRFLAHTDAPSAVVVDFLKEFDRRRHIDRPGGRKLVDLAGMKFGRWTVLALHPKRCAKAVRWHCVCDCGSERLVTGPHLRHGQSRSCGCLRRETTKTLRTKHGQAKRDKRGKRTRIYSRWTSMLQRCNNPNNNSFANYGARGIRVCERWLSFENFFADMGHPPRGKSLDRINVDGNYEPSNCRWASIFEQARNKRRARWEGQR
jgi:hypothetical protein